MIKILIVDDSHIFRERLKTFLSEYPEVKVIGEAGDGRTALSEAGRLKPDIVLMDVKLGAMNGLSTAGQLKGEFPEIKVIVLSKYDLTAYRETAISMGASAYVAKRTLVDELLPAIRRVMQTDQSSKPPSLLGEN